MNTIRNAWVTLEMTVGPPPGTEDPPRVIIIEQVLDENGDVVEMIEREVTGYE